MEKRSGLHELWRVKLWLSPQTYELMRLHASMDGLSKTKILSRGLLIRRHLEEVRNGTIALADTFFSAAEAGEILEANRALLLRTDAQARVIGNRMIPWEVQFRPELYANLEAAYRREGFDGMSEYARGALLLYDANSSYYS